MADNRYKDHAPIVAFARNGQRLVLGTGRPEEDLIHLHGSTGLGLAPADIKLRDRISADGSYLEGVRYGSRELFLPIFIQKESKAELTEIRRQLYRLLAPHLGPVEIIIHDIATGTRRSIQGVLKSGLEGDFSEPFHGNWQTLGLTFICPDPWWEGNPKFFTSRISPGVKPFISETVPFFPIILASSTVQGEIEVQIEGDAPISPIWQVTGPGTDLVISNGTDTFTVNHALREGETLTINGKDRRLTPDLWHKVPISSRIFDLPPGRNHLTVTMVGANTKSRIDLIYNERFLEAL